MYIKYYDMYIYIYISHYPEGNEKDARKTDLLE